MTRKSVKRSKNKPSSETPRRLYKRSRGPSAEEDPESENIPPSSTPSQNKSVREINAVLASQTPSHLNITAAADQGSPVSAPTISNTSVQGNIIIKHNSFLVTVVVPNSDNQLSSECHSKSVKDEVDEQNQIIPHKTEEILQKPENSQILHYRSRSRCLTYGDSVVDQPTLTLAEVKKNTNYLREITTTGKILETRPPINIQQCKEEMNWSHYALYDNTATVHLSLADTFKVNLGQWYRFKSVSICDFGKGNVLCSTGFTKLKSFTPLRDNIQDPKETVISGGVTEALVNFEYFCSCGAEVTLTDPKLFRIKCGECKKSCRCANVRNKAKAEVTIKQTNGADQRVVLTDELLHSIVNFKKEGFWDNHQLEGKLLEVEKMTVICVDGEPEPQRVQIEPVDKAKDSWYVTGWKRIKSLCLLS